MPVRKPMSETPSTADLARQAVQGDRRAADELMARLYGELHAIAEAAMNRERSGHTLQPTALVNEAYLKLADLSRMDFSSGLHIRATAAGLMRQVLVDHARKKNAAKRGGGGQHRVTLSGLADDAAEPPIDLMELDAALRELDELNPRHRRVVELRFFGSLTYKQIASLLGVSEQTVRLDWSMARAWLREQLQGD
jgi:RNA polymerase sigma factor (TIGR02999 family)